MHCRGIAIRDENGKPVRMLGAHNDITALKHTEQELAKKAEELEKANKKLEETLNGILLICTSCKKIRDDDGYWNRIEAYISTHTDAEFSHSLCPDCFKKLYPGHTYEE